MPRYKIQKTDLWRDGILYREGSHIALAADDAAELVINGNLVLDEPLLSPSPAAITSMPAAPAPAPLSSSGMKKRGKKI